MRRWLVLALLAIACATPGAPVDSADGDMCPDAAEDIDGFEDADGCPDPDNDRDGYLDVDDACPNDAGDGIPPGCPEGMEPER